MDSNYCTGIRGLGDLIAFLIHVLTGIKPCPRCQRWRAALNRFGWWLGERLYRLTWYGPIVLRFSQPRRRPDCGCGKKTKATP